MSDLQIEEAKLLEKCEAIEKEVADPSRRLVAFLERVLIPELQKEDRLVDLSKVGPEVLIANYRVYRFWCLEAVFRIAKKEDGLGDHFNWDYLLKSVSRSGPRFDTEIIAQLCAQSGSYEFMINLVAIWLDFRLLRAEIFRRLNGLKFSKAFYDYVKIRGYRELRVLLDVTASQIKAWLRKKKIWLSPRKRDLFDALSLRFNESGTVTLRLPGPALEQIDGPSNGRFTALFSRIQKLKDIRGEALLKIHDRYDRLKKAVTIDNLEDIPRSPIADIHPFENPHWEKGAHDYIVNDVRESVKRGAPLIDETMEKTPLKVHDRHRTLERRESEEKKENRKL